MVNKIVESGTNSAITFSSKQENIGQQIKADSKMITSVMQDTHNRINLIGLFFRNLFGRLFRHLLNVGALFLCALILSTDTVAISLLIYLPFLFIILLTSLGLSYLINFATLVFPDSEKAILIASRFLFFLSPIFWSADQGAGGIRNILVTYNPVSYYLSIARQIFYVEPFDSSKWIISMGITLAICVSSCFCYLRTKDIVRNIS